MKAGKKPPQENGTLEATTLNNIRRYVAEPGLEVVGSGDVDPFKDDQELRAILLHVVLAEAEEGAVRSDSVRACAWETEEERPTIGVADLQFRHGQFIPLHARVQFIMLSPQVDQEEPHLRLQNLVLPSICKPAFAAFLNFSWS